jgi:Homologous recombination OB-fold protein
MIMIMIKIRFCKKEKKILRIKKQKKMLDDFDLGDDIEDENVANSQRAKRPGKPVATATTTTTTTTTTDMIACLSAVPATQPDQVTASQFVSERMANTSTAALMQRLLRQSTPTEARNNYGQASAGVGGDSPLANVNYVPRFAADENAHQQQQQQARRNQRKRQRTSANVADASVRDNAQSPQRRRIPGPAGLLPPLEKGKKPPRGLFSVGRAQRSSAGGSGAGADSGRGGDANAALDADFGKGAWLAMLDAAGLPPFGDGAADSLLKYSIKYVSRYSFYKKVPQLAVLVKQVNSSEIDTTVLLKDPTGTIEGTLHHRVLERYGRDIVPGCVFLLRRCSLFNPSAFTHYLNITVDNIAQLFAASTPVPDDFDPRAPYSPTSIYLRRAPPRQAPIQLPVPDALDDDTIPWLEQMKTRNPSLGPPRTADTSSPSSRGGSSRRSQDRGRGSGRGRGGAGSRATHLPPVSAFGGRSQSLSQQRAPVVPAFGQSNSVESLQQSSQPRPPAFGGRGQQRPVVPAFGGRGQQRPVVPAFGNSGQQAAQQRPVVPAFGNSGQQAAQQRPVVPAFGGRGQQRPVVPAFGNSGQQAAQQRPVVPALGGREQSQQQQRQEQQEQQQATTRTNMMDDDELFFLEAEAEVNSLR